MSNPRLLRTTAMSVLALFATAGFSTAKAPKARRVLQPPQAAPRESQFYIKGPNAPFQNQIRKFTDPLNANGAGR